MRTRLVSTPIKTCRECDAVLAGDFYIVLHTRPGDDPKISVNDYLCPGCKERHDPTDRTE